MNARDEALLNDLMDGRLDTAAIRDLEERLEREPALREAYADLRLIGEALRQQDLPAAPADFLEQVRRKIDADGNTAEAAPPRLRLLPWLAPVAAAAAAVLIAVVIAHRDSADPKPREQARLDAPAPVAPESRAPGDAVLEADEAPMAVSERAAVSEKGGRFRGRGGRRTARASGARADAKSRVGRLKRAPEAEAGETQVPTFRLEASSLEEGRARLALVVAQLATEVEGEASLHEARTQDALRLVPSGQVAQGVLGSVMLSLTPTEVCTLERAAAEPSEGAEPMACEPAAPTSPAWPTASPGKDKAKTEEEDSERLDEPVAEKAAKPSPRVRVRVLIVERMP